MPRNRQASLIIAARRLRIAKMYLQRMTMRDIAEQLNVSVGTVCKDIKALKEDWLKESRETVDLIRARELAELDQMERDAATLYAVAARFSLGPDGRTPVTLPSHGRAQGWQQRRLQIKELRAKMLGYSEPKAADEAPAGETVFKAQVLVGGVIVCKQVNEA